MTVMSRVIVAFVGYRNPWRATMKVGSNLESLAHCWFCRLVAKPS